MKRWLTASQFRPFATVCGAMLVLVALDAGQGRVLELATAYSTLQTFATLGLVALGLGLSMMIREFDLSVAGMLGMAGCIAVLTGAESPLLGLALALAAGLAGGVVQGLIMVRLRLGSVGVTLGGLLTFVGIAFVLTQSSSVPYANMDAALRLNERIGEIFSLRSLIAIALFLLAAAVIGWTRIGRDLIATGSNREGAVIAGVNVSAIVVGTFAVSGMLAALAGALLSYSLAAASPSGLSDVLVPATAAAILGGVSLSGGTGRPLGIAAGVLTLAALRAGLNALGAPSFMNDVVTGGILLAVALLEGPDLGRRLGALRRRGAESLRGGDGAGVKAGGAPGDTGAAPGDARPVSSP
jgi:ribose/xylose/arabinose/galactoside ABC-type transport system permease subunit